MLENLEKGYGKTDDLTQQGLNNNNPSKSKDLEELNKSGTLTEDPISGNTEEKSQK